MSLFNASAHALKSVSPSLRVGGPATAGLDHLEDFVQACQQQAIPFDFVSTHHYPTDGRAQFPPTPWHDACPRGAEWDPDCFARQVLAARKQAQPPSLPLRKSPTRSLDLASLQVRRRREVLPDGVQRGLLPWIRAARHLLCRRFRLPGGGRFERRARCLQLLVLLCVQPNGFSAPCPALTACRCCSRRVRGRRPA